MNQSEEYIQWMTKTLKELCNTPSPSGFTHHISNHVLKILTQLG